MHLLLKVCKDTKKNSFLEQIKTKKRKILSDSPLLYNKSRTEDVNKLRMTGFECFAIFVIRRAKHAPKGAARH